MEVSSVVTIVYVVVNFDIISAARGHKKVKRHEQIGA